MLKTCSQASALLNSQNFSWKTVDCVDGATFSAIPLGMGNDNEGSVWCCNPSPLG